MSIISCIKKDRATVFRRLYMRRREQDGDYETDWQRIPNKYIKEWGTVRYSIEDIKPNHYKYSGMELSVVNNDGYFSNENEAASFFYNTLGPHRTMVKITAGYIDSTSTEYPTSSTLFIGLISGEETKYKFDNEIQYKINHISQIFDEIPADRVDGITSTQTASELFVSIRDYTDSGGSAYFQKFISSTVWYTTATTQNYNFATTTNLSNMSCWKLMQKVSEAENYVMYIDNNAALWFKERTGIPASSSFHFSGIGDSDKTFGHNIMRNISINEGLDKVYNRIRIKLAEDETLTSYYTYNEPWQWGDSSSSFKFGIKEYKYENEWLTSATAATIATAIYNEFYWPKRVITIDSKFVPQLMLMQRVDMTYKSKRYTTFDLWGYFLYGSGKWGGAYAYNIDIEDEDFYITEIAHDLETFKSTLKIKEI